MNGCQQECNVNGVQRGGGNSEMREADTLGFSIKHRHWLGKLTLVGESR